MIIALIRIKKNGECMYIKNVFVGMVFALACGSAFSDGEKIKKITVMSGDIEVPVEETIPSGMGRSPSVLYIHAKRGYDEVAKDGRCS